MISAAHAWMLAAAFILDAVVGDPAWLWRRIPHPVALIGQLIGYLDRTLNRPGIPSVRLRLLGAVVLVIVIFAAAVVGWLLERAFAALPYGFIGTVIVAAVFLAGRSLYDHVAAVASAFASGLGPARQAVSQIVGRDPASLDEPRICRAAIESTAENFSDGVVAPALWFLLLGLPGLLAYKAINTADSMIGHLTPHHRDFGWASARLDDLVNLPASRIAGLLITLAASLAGGSVSAAFRVMWTDAGKHRSPNAGWPEAAMAGALGIALAGPRQYAGVTVSDPFLNPRGRQDATPADIRRALRVYVGANALLVGVLVVLSLALLAV